MTEAFKCIMTYEFCDIDPPGSDVFVITADIANKTSKSWSCNDAYAVEKLKPFEYVVDTDQACMANGAKSLAAYYAPIDLEEEFLNDIKEELEKP